MQRVEFYLIINHSTHMHDDSIMMIRLQPSALHLRNPQLLLYTFFKLFELTNILVEEDVPYI